MNDGGVPGLADRLLELVGQVTADEFYRHETHYNRDSRLGRELLYLIANDDWIRSTTEVINLNRSDAIDSVIKLNVDTGKITHEAFGDKAGPLWLPLMVLAQPDSTGPDSTGPYSTGPYGAGPDSTGPAQAASPGQLTVVDGNGSLLAPMREADVWHAISAALSEIFVTTADTRWPWPRERRPGADRDQRVLLSAAMFRMLSGTRRPSGGAVSGGASRERYEETDSPLGEAKRKLGILLRRYYKAYSRPAQGDRARAADAEGRLLTSRAAELVSAFTRAVVVVVGVSRSGAPAVLTLTAPTRKLHDERRTVRRVLGQLQPRARLEIDLLLPSGNADRQVEIRAPDGVSIDLTARRTPAATPGLDADIIVTVDPPPAAARLATLMTSVLAEPVPAVRECLAGLALTQADTLGEVLNHHLVRPAPTEPYEGLYQSTARTVSHLHRLREQLRVIAASPPDPEPALAKLRETWGDGGWLRHVLLRRAAVSVPGPDTLTGRIGVIENTRQRVPPGRAKVTVPVEVADARFYSIARFSGAVSIVLMLVVISFYAFALTRHFPGGSGAPSPGVLASVLTLYSVIQAGRVEAPDRTTLRGRLTGAGNWLIIASTLPTTVLAIAIAFGIVGWAPVVWSAAAIASQALFLMAMWRGPLSAAGSHRFQPYRVLRTSPAPAYGKTGVLRSVWWQTATANALVLGRQAHGYLLWEHHPERGAAGALSLRPMLSLLQPGAPVANILAMLRSGTTRESVTFVVLREPPAGLPPDAVTIPLLIEPDRLTPAESPSEYVDVLVGVAGCDQFLRLRDHPVSAVLRAAKDQWLQVVETQLPVSPPNTTAPPDTLWARIRVGFRDPEYRRIAGFLRDVAGIGYPVWVRAWPEHVFRPLRAAPEDGICPARGTRRELMTARDFDVVSVARQHGEDTQARTWRMMALCVNTSFGVEHDVLEALAAQAPGLRLAAISHAELHGMDMFLVLCHVSEDQTASEDDGFERALARRAKAPSLRIMLDEWRTAEQLGFADRNPLLRVEVRARDRPGTLQAVLDSLHRALRRQLPSLPEADTSDWRVVLQTGAGRTALARLTVGLPVPADEVRDWPPSRWAEIARDARARAGAVVSGVPDVPEDMVINVRPVKRERPIPPPTPLSRTDHGDSPAPTLSPAATAPTPSRTPPHSGPSRQTTPSQPGKVTGAAFSAWIIGGAGGSGRALFAPPQGPENARNAGFPGPFGAKSRGEASAGGSRSGERGARSRRYLHVM